MQECTGMNKTYFIQNIKDTNVNWDRVNPAFISEYMWGGDYRPTALAKVVRVEGVGFLVRMFCAEKDPKAVYEFYGEPVYCDSALECFMQAIPGDPRYINVEMNAVGNSICAIGPDRYHRTNAADILGAPFPIVAETTENGWQTTCLLSFESIAKLYGVDVATAEAAAEFRGNFYKCGDETDIPHYGAWCGPSTAEPDFHTPGDFGRWRIAE